MNNFINTLLFFLSFLTLIVVIIIGRDLPVSFLRTTGYNIPYKEFIFLGLASLFLLLGGRRSAQRWMGVALIKKVKKYQWNHEVSVQRKNRVIFYLCIEAFFHLTMGGIFYYISKDSLPVFIVLLVLSADHLIFALCGKLYHLYRVGITHNAVVAVDREVRVLYFSGLRKISIHQQTIYFNYIKDLVLDFPSDMIASDEKESFKDVLKQQIDLKKVYLDETFKSF